MRDVHVVPFWNTEMVSLSAARRLAHRRRRCAAVRLIGSRMVFASVIVPLVGLLLHRNVLRRLPIAGLCVYTQLLA
jgi:hypothetical protein